MSKPMRHLHPLEQLPIGHEVSVGNMRGVVIGVQTVPAVPCGMIAVHTVNLTHKLVREFGNRNKIIEMDKPKNQRIGYCSIYIED